jgi:hypothetical protein
MHAYATDEQASSEVVASLTPCTPSTENCVTLLEELPLGGSQGMLSGILINTEGDESGLGGFINFIFQIGIGIAGVLGVVMLTIYGFQYAANDKNISTFSVLRERITSVVMGLLLLLGIFILLNTINPDLLLVEPELVGVELNIPDRSSDQRFIENLESVDISQITVSSTDINDPAFLMYLGHQQGEGGAPAIIWAANNGYTSVPSNNPFTNADINRNMRNNVSITEYQRITGQSEVTPVGFIRYWARKIKAYKSKTGSIPSEYASAIEEASVMTGVSSESLKVICMIESYGCTNASVVNKFGYSGLFQLSKDVFRVYGSGGSIFDPYNNALAAAKYGKHNINQIKKKLREV